MSAFPRDAPTLVFLHIPKTGGTTLSSILKGQYEPDRTFHVRDPGQETAPRHSPHYGSLAEFARLPTEVRRRFDCVLGHFPFGVHELIPKRSRYLTVLRDPVARCVSLHRQYVHHQVANGSFRLRDAPSLAEFLDLKPAVLRGQSVHDLAGRRRAECEADEGLLGAALENLRRHQTIVGTLERFDETVVVAARALGWRPPRYGIENRTSRYALAAPADVVERIRRSDGIERRLYEHANMMLSDAIARYGPDFEHDLAELRHRNRVERFGRLADGIRKEATRRLWSFVPRVARR